MNVERALPFFILATVSISALLLGMGQGDFEPFFVAILGVGASTILVDWLKWFQLPNWMANILAILVTVLTVSNFYFTNDSVRHLLGVGKLLVYLETILMFQKKSARVYWQVLVLSLLQIVVGAVFNLGFEGGVLFILYMMVAGLTMMVLHLYQDRQVVNLQNESVVNDAQVQPGKKQLPAVLVMSTNPVMPRGALRRMMTAFLMFASGALIFSILLFYFLPRENSSWAGPQEVPMTTTGFDDKVSLEHSDLIMLSTKLQMNVRYWNPGEEREPFIPAGEPYLRGMALSNLRVEGNRTQWIAPPYQIFNSDFRPLVSRSGTDWVVQEIVLEPSEDPLLYSVMPPRFMNQEESLTEFEWCWPLGAVTRQRSSEKLTVSHFRYQFKIPILRSGEFYSAYPYTSRDGLIPLTPERDPGNFNWLTYLDPERYPTLVEVAGELADEVSDGNHQVIAKRMESYFENAQYTYTLDFRDVERDESLDTVEDFFANYRKGHCEYFASALALMLRSQGIPSRMVVGYRGGDINGFGGHLDVEAKHAHAWVEAYIRPEDCSDAMIRSGQAGQYGAWLRLDATPPSDLETELTSTDEALDFAKSLWRDYVLGLQADTQSRVLSSKQLNLSGALKLLDLEWWQSTFSRMQRDLQEPNAWRRYVIPVVILIIFALGLSFYFRQRIFGQKSLMTEGATGFPAIRQRLSRVLRSVSPRLSRWIDVDLGDGAEQVPFYRQMLQDLERAGFRKLPQQTAREFATSVATAGVFNGAAQRVGTLTNAITDSYYLVRFGSDQLSQQQTEAIETAVNDLKELLKQTTSL